MILKVGEACSQGRPGTRVQWTCHVDECACVDIDLLQPTLYLRGGA